MFSIIKGFLKNHLSTSQKMWIQSVYNLVSNPRNVNMSINQLVYLNTVLRNSNIKYTPPVFIASISDACNLRCPNCLYLLENPDRFFPEFMEVSKFRYILEKYNHSKKAETVFFNGGEPLLHPHIDKLIDICLEYNISPKMSTNGILLKDKIHLLKKLDYINMSLDSYDPDTFRKYRGGTSSQFSSIMEGVKSLKDSGISFSLSFVISQENAFEVPKMIELSEKLMPNSIYFHNINPHGCKEYTPLCHDNIATQQFLNEILKRNDYPFDVMIPVIFNPQSKTFINGKCIQPWYYFLFNSKGDVSFCCHQAYDNKIGNVFEEYDFNSPKMIEFRDDVINGKYKQSCKFCQRRFMMEEYGTFDSKSRRWNFNKSQ